MQYLCITQCNFNNPYALIPADVSVLMCFQGRQIIHISFRHNRTRFFFLSDKIVHVQLSQVKKHTTESLSAVYLTLFMTVKKKATSQMSEKKKANNTK